MRHHRPRHDWRAVTPAWCAVLAIGLLILAAALLLVTTLPAV